MSHHKMKTSLTLKCGNQRQAREKMSPVAKKSARKNQQECEVLKGQEKICFNNSDVVTSVIIIVFL